MLKLKPCPYCGKDSGRVQPFMGSIAITCANCCAAIIRQDLTENEAIDAWNRRPDDEAEQPTRNYIGYVKTGSMQEPETFKFRVPEDATDEEIYTEAKSALWGSGIVSWCCREAEDGNSN